MRSDAFSRLLLLCPGSWPWPCSCSWLKVSLVPWFWALFGGVSLGLGNRTIHGLLTRQGHCCVVQPTPPSVACLPALPACLLALFVSAVSLI